MGASKLETADRFSKPKDLDANSVILFRLPRIFRLTFALKSQPADQFKSTVVKKVGMDKAIYSKISLVV